MVRVALVTLLIAAALMTTSASAYPVQEQEGGCVRVHVEPAGQVGVDYWRCAEVL